MSCLDEFNPTTHAAVVLTLSHLRRLLDMALAHAENPALDRCERTVEGVLRRLGGRSSIRSAACGVRSVVQRALW